MNARSADTDPEAERVQIDLLRKAGLARRVGMALALSGQVIGLARRAIARTEVNGGDLETRLRFVELHYGRELSRELREHLARRS
jgi:hypothetical protein